MNRFFIILMILLSICTSCKRKVNESNQSVFAEIELFEEHGKKRVCIKINNNSDRDVYISGMNRLVFGVNAEKKLHYKKTDATVEFYFAPFMEEDYIIKHKASLKASQEFDSGSTSDKLCCTRDYGPLNRASFKDSLISHLLPYVNDTAFYYFKSIDFDTLQMFDVIVECLFIPRQSSIVDSYEICMKNIDCDEMKLYFTYPTYNQSIYNAYGFNSIKDWRNYYRWTKISYPDTLLGFVHYTDIIQSNALVIKK